MTRTLALGILKNFPDPNGQTGFVIQDALGLARVDNETVQATLARVALQAPPRTYTFRIAFDLPQAPEAFANWTAQTLADALARAFPNCPEECIKVEKLDPPVEPPVTYDAATEWINSHQLQVKALAGRWVAISETSEYLGSAPEGEFSELLDRFPVPVRMNATFFFLPPTDIRTIVVDAADDPRACAAADAWAASERSFDLKLVTRVNRRLHDALDALESATRKSPLRKVLP